MSLHVKIKLRLCNWMEYPVSGSRWYGSIVQTHVFCQHLEMRAALTNIPPTFTHHFPEHLAVLSQINLSYICFWILFWKFIWIWFPLISMLYMLLGCFCIITGVKLQPWLLPNTCDEWHILNRRVNLFLHLTKWRHPL